MYVKKAKRLEHAPENLDTRQLSPTGVYLYTRPAGKPGLSFASGGKAISKSKTISDIVDTSPVKVRSGNIADMEISGIHHWGVWVC
jgi:hypothetical protein